MFDDSIEGIYETLKAAAMISKQVRTGAVFFTRSLALRSRPAPRPPVVLTPPVLFARVCVCV
jgi:hypothetical protein